MHGHRAARLWSAATSLLLIPVSLTLLPLHLAGPVYAVTAIVLGAGLSAYALTGLGAAGGSNRWARNFFLLTLAYLTLLFAALFVSAR